ncbi:conserved hypothetical protein [Xenorhabdus nematophila F1]|uniref:Uncharacterized protein n=1 Tax=Xenorhabdus nematophila (strain ATCC 19061 / DSM 3370 / CCUG 14189 / LMG 1036 / NCIMB 9965 / AN6) TaxID=406817 RepID=D3VL21_XENNA|nr:hypothetical protein XNC1_0909 [Xenorhabdus nematophila ATCC 19061]CCW32673.1 conserved hypothetical protein [Xenorhabdus nematophila F1]CEF29364.1 hypothetical protein XNW1_1700031 [Xenorhabdus nematophila str. Websteri]
MQDRNYAIIFSAFLCNDRDQIKNIIQLNIKFSINVVYDSISKKLPGYKL